MQADPVADGTGDGAPVDRPAIFDWVSRYPKVRPGAVQGQHSYEVAVSNAVDHAEATFPDFARLGLRRQRVIVDMLLTSGAAVLDEARDHILSLADFDGALSGGGTTASPWVDEVAGPGGPPVPH